EPQNNLTVVEANLLATPNKSTRQLLPEALQKDPSMYPSQETLAKLKFLEDLGDALPRLSRMWTELKS
ncbi:MAG: spermidine/putrescine ABC transporter substrate-binding protein, partial [Proteobacteria bacterium]|nr:spermidine/putrescine ABC transporter substrate-binding protein [Pseudomonadota bacterium]